MLCLVQVTALSDPIAAFVHTFHVSIEIASPDPVPTVSRDLLISLCRPITFKMWSQTYTKAEHVQLIIYAKSFTEGMTSMQHG